MATILTVRWVALDIARFDVTEGSSLSVRILHVQYVLPSECTIYQIENVDINTQYIISKENIIPNSFLGRSNRENVFYMF